MLTVSVRCYVMRGDIRSSDSVKTWCNLNTAVRNVWAKLSMMLQPRTTLILAGHGQPLGCALQDGRKVKLSDCNMSDVWLRIIFNPKQKDRNIRDTQIWISTVSMFECPNVCRFLKHKLSFCIKISTVKDSIQSEVLQHCVKMSLTNIICMQQIL